MRGTQVWQTQAFATEFSRRLYFENVLQTEDVSTKMYKRARQTGQQAVVIQSALNEVVCLKNAAVYNNTNK